MAHLSDSTRLTDLTLPGTHDSGSFRAGVTAAFSQTQNLNLEHQLSAGIRAFDLRLGWPAVPNLPPCRDLRDDLWVTHAEICMDQTFSQALATMTAFLAEHRSETLVVRVKEDPDKPDTATFSRIVRNVLDRYRSYLYSTPGRFDPRLAQMRGKIVILQDWSHEPNQYGLWLRMPFYGSQPVPVTQDEYKECGATKLGSIVTYFRRATTANRPPGVTSPRLYSNYISTACIYAPVPRISAALLNPRIADAIHAHGDWTRLGLVFADFPPPDLIGSIIDVNARFARDVQGLEISPGTQNVAGTTDAELRITGARTSEVRWTVKTSPAGLGRIWRVSAVGPDGHVTLRVSRSPGLDTVYVEACDAIKTSDGAFVCQTRRPGEPKVGDEASITWKP
jgi:1-phosphatidylinositol phosphodiesterase